MVAAVTKMAFKPPENFDFFKTRTLASVETVISALSYSIRIIEENSRCSNECADLQYGSNRRTNLQHI